MSENTILTTTITSEEYRRLLCALKNADRLAEAIAADWLSSAGFSFNKPSAATLEALKRFDPELYFDTKKKVWEVETKMSETISKAADRIITPALPYLAPDDPGVPVPEILIGDNPGSDPKITCETDMKGETT